MAPFFSFFDDDSAKQDIHNAGNNTTPSRPSGEGKKAVPKRITRKKAAHAPLATPQADSALTQALEFNVKGYNANQNKAIEFLLETASIEHNPELEYHFYNLLLNAYLLIPTTGKADGYFHLTTTLDDDYGECLPVFTSELHMAGWVLEPTQYVVVSFQNICRQALEKKLNGLLLNPSPTQQTFLSAHQLLFFCDGMIPQQRVRPTVSNPLSIGEVLEESFGNSFGQDNRRDHTDITLAENTEITLAHADTPTAAMLMERLRGCFTNKRDAIAQAYLFEMTIENGLPHLALGVELWHNNSAFWDEALMPDLIAITKEVIEAYEYVDFFCLNEADELHDTLRELFQPFFVGDGERPRHEQRAS